MPMGGDFFWNLHCTFQSCLSNIWIIFFSIFCQLRIFCRWKFSTLKVTIFFLNQMLGSWRYSNYKMWFESPIFRLRVMSMYFGILNNPTQSPWTTRPDQVDLSRVGCFGGQLDQPFFSSWFHDLISLISDKIVIWCINYAFINTQP